jgi:hypothetical protein
VSCFVGLALYIGASGKEENRETGMKHGKG